MQLDFIREKSEDELIAQGEAAKGLLQSSAYSKACFDLTEACTQIFFTSEPQATVQREDAYTLMRAMQEISATLAQRVAIMDDILEKRELQTSVSEFQQYEEDL